MIEGKSAFLNFSLHIYKIGNENDTSLTGIMVTHLAQVISCMAIIVARAVAANLQSDASSKEGIQNPSHCLWGQKEKEEEQMARPWLSEIRRGTDTQTRQMKERS